MCQTNKECQEVTIGSFWYSFATLWNLLVLWCLVLLVCLGALVLLVCLGTLVLLVLILLLVLIVFLVLFRHPYLCVFKLASVYNFAFVMS